MRPMLLLLLCLLAAAPARAQAPSPPDSVDARVAADIRELIELTGAVALGTQFADRMLATLRPMFEQAYPTVPPEVMDELLEETHAELAALDLAALAVPVYARHLSAEDIRGLLDFYRTPLGRRVVEKLPVIVEESVAVGQAMGEAAGQRVIDRLVRRLEARGYAEGG